jgi:hypothetical protein
METHENGRTIDFKAIDKIIQNHVIGALSDNAKMIKKSLMTGELVYDEDNDHSFYRNKLMAKCKGLSFPTWMSKEVYKRFTNDERVESAIGSKIIHRNDKKLVCEEDYVDRCEFIDGQFGQFRFYKHDYISNESHVKANRNFNVAYDCMNKTVFICIEMWVNFADQQVAGGWIRSTEGYELRKFINLAHLGKDGILGEMIDPTSDEALKVF